MKRIFKGKFGTKGISYVKSLPINYGNGNVTTKGIKNVSLNRNITVGKYKRPRKIVKGKVHMFALIRKKGT
jgi:hypothetical protein